MIKNLKKVAIEAIAANGNLDLIFMDTVMPEVDGFTACRKLANDKATKDIPVIFMAVANEVQRLAESSREATGQISLLVKNIRSTRPTPSTP